MMNTATETATAKTTTAKLPKTATVTLRASDGSVMYIVAERKSDGARTYVITTDANKKTARGMTETHPTFDAARTAIAASAAKAEKLGWTRKVAGRMFAAKPDAFSNLPAAPKGRK